MPSNVPTMARQSDAARRLSDTAYDRILQHLFDGTLSAGAFMSQTELTALVGIPTAPLRDALRILETEGVLTIQPRSGIQFTKPGLELTKSTFQFRQILECAAIRVFAETAPSGALDEIAARHETLRARVERGRLDEWAMEEIASLEHALHTGVIAILRNALIETSYRRIHNYLRLVKLDWELTPPLLLRTLHEHMDIIEACRARNPDRAEAALRTHFSAALQRHLGLF